MEEGRGGGRGGRGLLALMPCFALLKWLMGIVRIKIAVEEKQTKITRDSRECVALLSRFFL